MEQPKDYDRYNTNDFITDGYFLQWVRFPDEESNAFWQAWISTHQHQQQQIDNARAFLRQLYFVENLPAPDMVQASLKRSLERISVMEAVPEKGNIRKIWWWAAAAVLAGCMALAGQQFWKKAPAMIQYSGLTHEVRKVWLPDSSVVLLNANAEISFSSSWEQAGAREVWLKGEAFFDIKPVAAGKQAARAFIVHSGKMDIDVLGTSFNVREGQTFTNVTLNTGKIKIRFSDLPEQPVYLNPGDFVQYSARNNKVIKKRVNADLYADWKEEGHMLKNVTLKEIAAYIEDVYGYPVKISSDKLAKQELSGGLRVKDEKLLLETLAFTLNAKIEKHADTLFIQPKIKK
ncbi:FecR domain-containing protein [Chitinophaga sp. MM2321]|uniref:FecR family protein n=1 Tax=Chitinophaga sp. MM2321 TaxID=3137178 RepID=UPI0032D59288